MEIGALVTALSLIAAVGVPAIAFGIIKHKVDAAEEKNAGQEKRIGECALKSEVAALSKRADEDRERNIEAHKDMYTRLNRHEATIAELKQILTYMQESLNDVKKSIDKGFDKLERDIKGMGGK
jgi:DNA anti-recombination protein RmuC